MNLNKTVVDLGKVQYANFYYTNKWGQTRTTLPTGGKFTVYGVEYDKNERIYSPNSKEKGELIYDRALKQGALDEWIPTLRLQLTANHSLVYKGDKAVTINKAWREKIYGQK